jgi:hypothetical protein
MYLSDRLVVIHFTRYKDVFKRFIIHEHSYNITVENTSKVILRSELISYHSFWRALQACSWKNDSCHTNNTETKEKVFGLFVSMFVLPGIDMVVLLPSSWNDQE